MPLPPVLVAARRLAPLIAALALTACGAEVAPAAAAMATRQASQAEDGRRQAEQVRQQLDEMVKAREAAASAALQQAQ